MKTINEPRLGDGLVSAEQTWAWWSMDNTVPTRGWDFLSPGERLYRHLRLAAAFAAVRNGEVHLLEYARPASVAAWMDRVEANALAGHPAEWLGAMLDGTVEHLDAERRYEPWSVMGVRVDVDPVNTIRTERRLSRIGEPWRKFRRAVEADRWPTYVQRADEFSLMLGTLTGGPGSPARLDDAQLRWLCAHPAHRGVPDYDIEGGDTVVDTRVVRDGPVLRYEHPAGTAYAMWQAATGFPLDLTDIEWLLQHRHLGFPVDVSVRVELIEPSAAAKQAADTGDRALQHASYLAEMRRAIPPDLLEQIDTLPQIAADIRKGRAPIAKVFARYCVWADTKAELAERASELRREMLNVGVQLVTPAGAEQARVDLEALPASGARHPSWFEVMPAFTLAQSAFGLTTRFGDRNGPYLMRNMANGQPIGFDPLAGSVEQDGTVTAFVGQLGSGKTFGSLVTAVQSKLRGADVIDMDPKSDSVGVHQVLPPGVLQTIEYGVGSQPGSADPFLITGRVTDAAVVASDLVRILIPASEWEAYRTAIVTACNNERDEGNPLRPATFSGVIDRLRRTAPAVAASLEAARSLRIASALFAEPGVTIEPFSTHGRWTRIAFPGLSLDDADQGSIQSAVTTALLTAVGAGVMEHCFAQKTGRATLLRWDEFHRVSRSTTGVQLVNLVAREGRAFDVALLLSTQVVADIPRAVLSVIASVFAFRTPVEATARQFCEILGIDESFASTLMQMPRPHEAPGGLAQLLYKDRNGAVAHAQLDPTFRDWLEAFNTNPDRRLDAPAA